MAQSIAPAARTVAQGSLSIILKPGPRLEGPGGAARPFLFCLRVHMVRWRCHVMVMMMIVVMVVMMLVDHAVLHPVMMMHLHPFGRALVFRQR
jgi:hypothetical protein